ncbi:MAG TPA: hypothetical protein VK928_06850 [Longimicrobiales bacterium]|nr:hypothetical protein [Longimicrobiales bacterium]
MLRSLHRDAASMAEVCDRMVRFLYDSLGAGGGRACSLVRAYKTHECGALAPDLRAFAAGVAGVDVPPSTKCLTLLATAGDEPEWNDVTTSRSHRALPLLSREAVERLPMVAQLVRQLGLETDAVVAPDASVFLDMQQRTFNVFHVEEALGSPYIPAQDFVRAHGVRSVVGFGTVLPNGDLFAVILFARVVVPRETAVLFRPLSLAAKLSVLPFLNDRVFAMQADA